MEPQRPGEAKVSLMRILITAGPTREPIDSVRYISNHSSGKLGLALSRAAIEAGHEVTLLLGPGIEPPPEEESTPTARVLRFQSAQDLGGLLNLHFVDHDMLVMAAAVADFRPTRIIDGKRSRPPAMEGANPPPFQTGNKASDHWTLRLEPTPDLVASLARHKKPHQRIVAFALASAPNLHTNGNDKIERKHVDAIVANPLETMNSDEIEPLWITATGHQERPGLMSKTSFARWLMSRISRL